ncbi:hypothetical protein L3081_20980 [Colwellia sp. MSW7]|uniref:PKD domain-containing protein n=1 Tax=Colwellia maritima TaxID=2912588 RepID=A0ABS9X5P1_9GAMM|nr:hypothetical protein [Colwellia maritima]MCI2285405.1 hypothetical protein [Colwellia maritima]
MVTCIWSGPEGVTFADKSSGVTTATFAATGKYVLSLTSGDGELTSTDKVTIIISPTLPVQEETNSSGGSMAYSLFLLTILSIRRLFKN